MDPNERRRRQGDHPPELSPPAPTGAAASTGNLAAPASSSAVPQRSQRNATPSPTRRSPQPQPQPVVTPVVEGETNTEYFPPLDPNVPSLTAQPSNLSIPQRRPHSTSNVSSQNRPRSASGQSAASGSLGDAAPVLTRQPSIRIRRRSSSQRSQSSWKSRFNRKSQQDLAEAGVSSNVGGQSSGSAGRPRSVSQPEQVHVPHDVSNSARGSRRAQPSVAMPRLTEEGTRPNMEELGLDGRSPSPQSLPDERLNLSRNQTEPSDGPPRLQKMRNMSRFFWPRRQAEQDNQSEPDPRTEEEIRRQDEYDERLVDYLDTVGKEAPRFVEKPC